MLTALLVSVLPTFAVSPMLFTQPVSTDPDDPAIWVNPVDASKSVIYGTDKTAAPQGGLYAFGLNGAKLQHIENLDRPNNVDVEYGLKCGAEQHDIVVTTERLQGRLRVFFIDPATGKLADRTGETRLFDDFSGDAGQPMGIACYRRKKDGTVFAIVSPKTGPKTDYLMQVELKFNPSTQKVDTKFVRRFGSFSGEKEIESIAVDDELGYVYYSDETVGTRKYGADPSASNAGKELALFNQKLFEGDHEGIAIWNSGSGKGYLICTDQLNDNSRYYIYRREGEPGNPNDHQPIAMFTAGVDETDGIEVVSAPLGSRYPKGMMVAMNSGPQNFAIINFQDILSGLTKR